MIEQDRIPVPVELFLEKIEADDDYSIVICLNLFNQLLHLVIIQFSDQHEALWVLQYAANFILKFDKKLKGGCGQKAARKGTGECTAIKNGKQQ